MRRIFILLLFGSCSASFGQTFKPENLITLISFDKKQATNFIENRLCKKSKIMTGNKDAYPFQVAYNCDYGDYISIAKTNKGCLTCENDQNWITPKIIIITYETKLSSVIDNFVSYAKENKLKIDPICTEMQNDESRTCYIFVSNNKTYNLTIRDFRKVENWNDKDKKGGTITIVTKIGS